MFAQSWGLLGVSEPKAGAKILTSKTKTNGSLKEGQWKDSR